MSLDLFAAFGDPAPEPVSTVKASDHGAHANFSGFPGASGAERVQESSRGSAEQVEDEDDFGDFEDANAVAAERESLPRKAGDSRKPNLPFDIQKKQSPVSELSADSKIGKHPFAGHMDFLFDGGDDEYDAGADDLENLASNPEAAMAYSKRIIAEQEAKSRTNLDPTKAYAQQLAAHTKELSSKVSQSATSQSSRILAEQQSRSKKLTKPPPPSISKSQNTSNPILSISRLQNPSNPPPARNKLQKKSGYVPAKDPNVLFDADNLSESDEADDDFGDFEGGPTTTGATITSVAQEPPRSQPEMPNIDLLGLDDAPPPSLGQIGRTRSASLRQADTVLGPTKPKHTPSSSLSSAIAVPDDNPWADFGTKTAKAALPPKSVVIASADVEDDAWDDFETTETAPAPAVKASSIDLSSQPNHTRTKSESQLPPTNIPPPALLLSIFPSVFSSAQDALLTPLSKLDTAQRNQLLAHPASNQFLRSLLNSVLVLAHIIAGRKLRWKRDQILTQSMRIGPAAAGGKGGMKLAGVDKSEVTKEEREVLDAVRLWKAQVGKLRGAVSGATASGRKLPPVPDIGEQMPVKTLKAVEGGFVAPHACALCGMKREERIAKIDEAVEDSFGEWWVQGMDMHVFCKNWWEENKNKLRSR